MTARGAVSVDELAARARAVRRAVVGMAHTGQTPHVGSALSCVDVMVALYFHALRADPVAPRPDSDDRFIMSKGHGCMAQYATLAERGYFPAARLAEYARNGGALAEHPGPGCVPGIDVATGSLGHGPAIATGLALARAHRGRPGRVFVLVSDGECNEGSVWEAAMFAAGRGLDRLAVVVDYNGLQAMGRCDDITALSPLADKWRAFGWATRELDGHDLGALVAAFDALPFEPGRPSALVARTVKGKGVSFMEDETEWHYRPPSADDLARALRELG